MKSEENLKKDLVPSSVKLLQTITLPDLISLSEIFIESRHDSSFGKISYFVSANNFYVKRENYKIVGTLYQNNIF